MTNYQWQEAKMTDAQEIVNLFAAENQHEPQISVPALNTIEHTIQRILSTPQGEIILIRNNANQLIAMALVMLLPEEKSMTAQCRGHVHIDYRRQGIGTQLFNWIIDQINVKRQQTTNNKPVQLITSCRGFMRDRIALFESQDLTPIRYQIQMRRHLHGALPTRQLSSDITICQWSKEQDDAFRQTFNLVFQKNWGVPQFSPEMWRKRFIDTPHFRPGLTYLAYAKGTLIGFCLSEYHVEQNTQENQREAWMEAIGVHPEWRSKGIASMLMCHTMHIYQATGFTHAGLDVDAQNWTNAIALYQKLGFNEVQREIIYAKEIN